MPLSIKHLTAALLMALALFTTVPAVAAIDNTYSNNSNSTQMQMANGPIVTQDIPRVVEYRFRETNAKVSDLRLHLYLGLLGLFLVIIVLFLYFKWNVQSMSMSIENLRRRQDDLIKLLQMNNGKLKQNISKLERTLYDLSEIQVKISKKIKGKDNSDIEAQLAQLNQEE